MTINIIYNGNANIVQGQYNSPGHNHNITVQVKTRSPGTEQSVQCRENNQFPGEYGVGFQVQYQGPNIYIYSIRGYDSLDVAYDPPVGNAIYVWRGMP